MQGPILKPSPLKKGDTIGLVSPSSPMRPERLALGLSFLESKGFKVKLGTHLQDATRFLAGTDIARAKDIMDFFKDDSIHAIMATAGGYGSQRLLPHLDFSVIQKNPKWLTGFSDTTALQLGLLKMTGLTTCTGFTFRDLDEGGPDSLVESTLMQCLLGESYTITEGKTLVSGEVRGNLTGGNLALTAALMGTSFQPDFKNTILLIEDVFAEPYAIDCRLSQLELGGVFEKVNGVIFGQFELCDAKAPLEDGEVSDVIAEWGIRINKPCIYDFPYGHGKRRAVLPLGSEVLLNADTSQLTVEMPHNKKCAS